LAIERADNNYLQTMPRFLARETEGRVVVFGLNLPQMPQQEVSVLQAERKAPREKA